MSLLWLLRDVTCLFLFALFADPGGFHQHHHHHHLHHHRHHYGLLLVYIALLCPFIVCRALHIKNQLIFLFSVFLSLSFVRDWALKSKLLPSIVRAHTSVSDPHPLSFCNDLSAVMYQNIPTFRAKSANYAASV